MLTPEADGASGPAATNCQEDVDFAADWLMESASSDETERTDMMRSTLSAGRNAPPDAPVPILEAIAARDPGAARRSVIHDFDSVRDSVRDI